MKRIAGHLLENGAIRPLCDEDGFLVTVKFSATGKRRKDVKALGEKLHGLLQPLGGDLKITVAPITVVSVQ